LKGKAIRRLLLAMQRFLSSKVLPVLKFALAEDIGSGDVTTDGIVPLDAKLRGQIVAKQAGVVAGLDIAWQVFQLLDAQVKFISRVDEGTTVKAGEVLAAVFGSARALLTGERTALNFLNRMSGIATLTRQFVAAVSHTRAVILDTRKTAPGLRVLDKLAVARGGGQNHRFGLFDLVLIKDNHIDFAGSIEAAVGRARASENNLEIEVETRTLRDVQTVLGLGIRRILLDNMTVEMLREAVKLNAGRAKLEASGNVTLENVRAIAETGVDYISVGALTHSAKSFDASLEWIG
jgi:nicotinate-nucleotide pyrophosphorylase (carboxylating)